MALRLVLYQPDIPQNAGTLLRLAACLGIGVDLIEPFGFVWSDRHLRRAGLDYVEWDEARRHPSWSAYIESHPAGRLVLLTTSALTRHVDTQFRPDDRLMLGRETNGVPDAVHAAADLAIRVPMRAGRRSINVALAGAMVLGEALRQVEGFGP